MNPYRIQGERDDYPSTQEVELDELRARIRAAAKEGEHWRWVQARTWALCLLAALVTMATQAFLTGCPKPQPPQPPPPDAADAQGPFTCVTACANLRILGCREGMGAPDGSAPCETVCDHALQIEDLDLACISHASSPDAVRLCQGMRGVRSCQ